MRVLKNQRLLCVIAIGSMTVVPSRMMAMQSASRPQAPTHHSTGRDPYVLGTDDQVVIHAPDLADISEKPHKIDRDGDLRLPMVGRVHAAGMTAEQLEIELATRLKVYFYKPDVSVAVIDSRSQPVSILGAVVTGGVKQLEGGKTLLEVLSAAGGLTPDAGPIVRIARRIEMGRIPLPEAADDSGGAFSIVDLDAKALLDGRSPEKNINILSNDVISVPRAEVVFVIGEVSKPGPVILSGARAISVMEAVSSSGGTLRTAAPNRVRILRRVPGQDNRLEMNVDLQRIMNGRAKDMALAPGDILVIPDSSGKRMTTRVIEAAIQMGTMIGTYGIIR